jgi:hypothetical protein
MDRLEAVMEQPSDRRAVFLEAMYADAAKGIDGRNAAEVVSIMEEVQGTLGEGHDFQPKITKLRDRVAVLTRLNSIPGEQIVIMGMRGDKIHLEIQHTCDPDTVTSILDEEILQGVPLVLDCPSSGYRLSEKHEANPNWEEDVYFD